MATARTPKMPFLPKAIHGIYGVNYYFHKKDTVSQRLQFEATVEYCGLYMDEYSIYHISKKEYVVNRNETDEYLYDIAKKCADIIYPITVLLDRNGHPVFIRTDDIVERWSEKRQIKPFAEWLSKLDYLRSCLIELRFKQYAIPEMPQLFTYKEYTAVRHKKISLSKSMDQVYVNQRDALRVNTIEPKSTVKWRYLSAKLREETNNLEELFKSINAFYQFMTEVDCAKKVIKPCSIQDVIDIYQQKYPEIEAIEKIKQEMYRETEFLEIAKAIYLLDNTSFQEHSFDLANPKMIEEAIDNGRIKPFPRAARKTKD